MSQISNDAWEEAGTDQGISTYWTQNFFSSVASSVIQSFRSFSFVLKRLNHNASVRLPTAPAIKSGNSGSYYILSSQVH